MHRELVKRNVWIASYPRSGNTLLRLILAECFELGTKSKYPESSEAVLAFFGGHLAGERYLTKTHDPPEDDNPAIYLIRDGRATIVSYYHYCRDYGLPVSMENVIRGTVGFGSWSGHYDAWNPFKRPQTIVVRYEELAKNMEAPLERIAAFLGIRP